SVVFADPELLGVGSLLKKYISLLCTHIGDILPVATSIASTGRRHFAEVSRVIEGDLTGVLLPELVVSIVLLLTIDAGLMQETGSIPLLAGLLEHLDRFNHLAPGHERDDNEDLAWPGIMGCFFTGQSSKNNEEVSLIRKADLENHNKDGGFWTVIDGKVYDIKDFQAQSQSLAGNSILAQFAGEDPVVALEAALQFEDTRESMQAFCVGQYMEPNQETVTTPDLSSLSSPLIDTERNLGLLLGLHASYLAKSTPLSPMEIECAKWLQSSIFSGGLQTSQIHYNYNEEKDEDHCSSLGSTTPEKAKLYSRRITLSDHAQPFLQAIADNNTQDHTVKDFLCQIERCCKQYHLITPITFPPEHPVEEVGRLLLCCLLKHQDLGHIALSLVSQCALGVDQGKQRSLPKSVIDVCRMVYQAKCSLIKTHQEQGRSYKEVCAPVIERLRFLFNELRPAVSNDLSIVSKLKLLSSQPRWRRITQKLIRDRRKKRVPKKSESADIEEPKLENEGTDGEELNVHISPTPADRKSPTSKTSKDKWHPLLNTVAKVQKYRWLKHSVHGVFSQSSLMVTIVEFALKEEPLDVEKMRKCLLKQLERAEVRLEGIDTMLKLASKSFLLPSVQYAMLCGWQRVVPEGTNIGFQILALRLLQAVLPSWDKTECSQDMKFLVEKLFNFLGILLSTCSSDLPLLREGSLRRRKSRPQASLTATHSSTLAEEIVSVLRTLHALNQWNSMINNYINTQLSSIGDVMAGCQSEACFLEEYFPDSDAPRVGSLMAVMAVIGGIDGRLRLGGQVVHEEYGEGTVTRITPKGRITVQFHEMRTSRVCLLGHLKPLPAVSFSVQNLPFSEPMLVVWAQLVSLAGSKLEKQRMKKSVSRGLTADQVDVHLLRCQQLRLYILKAGRALLSHQDKLRQILSQAAVLDIGPNPSEDPVVSSPDVGDLSPEGPLPPLILLQQLLSAATQPSPIKAIFDKQEMEAAALAVCQYLAVESAHPSSPLFEESSSSEATTPVTVQHVRPPKQKKQKTSPVPPLPIVLQLMDMGFPRKNVEFALKSLSGTTGSASGVPGVEALVGWLLDHPDIQVTEVSDADTVSDEYSDEEVLEELEEAEPTFPVPPGAVVTESQTFKKRSDFQSNDDYAVYVRENIQVGMMVKCCRTYEEVFDGDVGKVIKLDRDGLHDLNVQCDWQQKGGTYWVRYIHIELLGFPPQSSPSHIKIGDKVRVKPSVTTPKYKWGSVTHRSVGVVKAFSANGKDVIVDFPQQSHWTGLLSEMELVPSVHPGVRCDGCQMFPINGPRFKCRNCDDFDFCDNCFKTRKHNTRHSFGRINEPGQSPAFSGRSGKQLKKHQSSQRGMLIDDWSRAVKSLSVSSSVNQAARLIDCSDQCWQSSGSQGKHWVRLELFPDVLVHRLKMVVDPADSSYMPSLVVVSGGSSLNNLIELKTININPTDTTILLLSDCTEYHRYLEVSIKQCRSSGIDCKIHGLGIVGRIRAEDEDLATVPFLASDNEEEEDDKTTTGSLARKKSSGLESSATIRTKVFVWGLNDKDQLGGLKGSKIKVPSFSETLSALNVVQVAGGSKSLFAVTVEGKIYACGEATNGRLGLGLSSGTIPIPRQITALSNYVVKKVAVHSGGRHAMALTVDGKVFSWGEGDDGKLGHFSRMNCDKPRLIEALKTKRIRDIACGSSHSAAITSSGELYSWGLGEYGRLGHGDNTTQLRPKLVKVLLGHRVIQVACGSRDAQTLALTDEGLVFSWGDGDFGKLGRGGSEGCNIPQNIERLNGQAVCQIECGAQFSLALTKSGVVWTWGKGDYFRLGHGTDVHVRKPQMVEGLRGKKIVHVAVGALHCLAVTETGQVFAWGDNDHGQQGNGTTTVNRKPTLVQGLEGQKITRVACGSSHSVAWTTVDVTTPSVHEPVLFQTARDSLGASYLGNPLFSSQPITTDQLSGLWFWL
ncbi:E3 ubiquitin-protein ligase HERC2-like, partial [Anarrhichthys ocellatus]|uniref:E3 ubiquitin-protein ligase HERC2-like n=1 Tax=Anarrhichthys ocellatus TaxID=433405 RepID=UPI0012EED331